MILNHFSHQKLYELMMHLLSNILLLYLHKINRYGLSLRSDLVLKLNENINIDIGKIESVKKITNHKYFCSLIVGKNQKILYEKYADDFSKSQPQTIMSITKMFANLFVGELLKNKKINLNKNVSYYLPKIGSGYAKAKVQDILNMNVVNAYTEDYTKAYSSSFMHEPVGGWRLPKSGQIKLSQEQYLNTIKNIKNRDLKNNSEAAIKGVIEQNEKIIEQNEEILKLLKKEKND